MELFIGFNSLPAKKKKEKRLLLENKEFPKSSSLKFKTKNLCSEFRTHFRIPVGSKLDCIVCEFFALEKVTLIKLLG